LIRGNQEYRQPKDFHKDLDGNKNCDGKKIEGKIELKCEIEAQKEHKAVICGRSKHRKMMQLITNQ